MHNLIILPDSARHFSATLVKSAYNVSKMREHLTECLENGNMSQFTKEKVRGRCKLNSFTCKVVKILICMVLLQTARMHRLSDVKIANVRYWIHRKCLDLDSAANEVQCPSCEQQNQRAVANCVNNSLLASKFSSMAYFV